MGGDSAGSGARMTGWTQPRAQCGVCDRLSDTGVRAQGLNDAEPRLAVDSLPPSRPIYAFYPRGPDRTRTFPRGQEVAYFDKHYSDGCVKRGDLCCDFSPLWSPGAT